MKAYEEAIRATAALHAPWFVVPADEQWESRAIVGRLVRERLEQMSLEWPVLTAEEKADLAKAERLLKAE